MRSTGSRGTLTCTPYDQVGHLLTAANGTDGLTWTYDLAGEMLSERSTRNASAVEYTYDQGGNRESVSLNGAYHALQAFDEAGRLQYLAASTAAGWKTFAFSYDQASRRTALLYPNALLTGYSYDTVSRLTGNAVYQGTTAVDFNLYGYNTAGERTAKATPFVGEGYGYDVLSRLATATRSSSVTESYAYDPVGNRTSSLGEPTWTYDDRNELLSAGSTTFAYDLNGNMIRKTEGTSTTSYEWNAENQLVRVVKDGAEIARVAYDPLGRRVEAASGGTTYKFVYDGAEILQQSDGTTTSKHVHGPGIDERLGTEVVGGSQYYYHADALGSTTLITDVNGTPVLRYVYDSFGQIQLGATVGGPAFTGREWDPSIGLYYYRARYYDPKVGRFISEDPSWVWSWPNLYAYVENDPINYTDPFGLLKVKQGVAVPTGPLLINLRCLEECIGRNLEIRVTETTGRHPPGNPHTRGVAADFTIVPRDPFIDPKRPVPTPVNSQDVLCCARACSFNFSQFEPSPAHFHVQIPPGRGGAVRPKQTDCCN